MDATTNTRTSLSAYLLAESAKEPDATRRRLIELTAQVPTRCDMRRYTPSEKDDIAINTFRRCLEPPQRGNRKGIDDASLTEGMREYLDSRGLKHDPLKAFFEARLREEQRLHEERAKRAPKMVALTDGLLERLERSRARATAHPSPDQSKRGKAAIDREIESLTQWRVEGARASVERGIVRDPAVLEALAAIDKKRCDDAERFRKLVERLSEVDPAADWSSETLQALEVADASFWESVERNLAHWRRELACRTGCSRRRAEIALQFPIFLHAQEIERRNGARVEEAAPSAVDF